MQRRIRKNGAQNLQIMHKEFAKNLQFFGAEVWRPYTYEWTDI